MSAYVAFQIREFLWHTLKMNAKFEEGNFEIWSRFKVCIFTFFLDMSLSGSCPESSSCVRIWFFRLDSFVATPCKWWGLQLYVGRPHQGNDFGHRLAINSSFKACMIFTCFGEFFWSPSLPSSMTLSLSTECLWLLRPECFSSSIWNAFMQDPETPWAKFSLHTCWFYCWFHLFHHCYHHFHHEQN